MRTVLSLVGGVGGGGHLEEFTVWRCSGVFFFLRRSLWDGAADCHGPIVHSPTMAFTRVHVCGRTGTHIHWKTCTCTTSKPSPSNKEEKKGKACSCTATQHFDIPQFFAVNKSRKCGDTLCFCCQQGVCLAAGWTESISQSGRAKPQLDSGWLK